MKKSVIRVPFHNHAFSDELTHAVVKVTQIMVKVNHNLNHIYTSKITVIWQMLLNEKKTE